MHALVCTMARILDARTLVNSRTQSAGRTHVAHSCCTHLYPCPHARQSFAPACERACLHACRPTARTISARRRQSRRSSRMRSSKRLRAEMPSPRVHAQTVASRWAIYRHRRRNIQRIDTGSDLKVSAVTANQPFKHRVVGHYAITVVGTQDSF